MIAQRLTAEGVTLLSGEAIGRALVLLAVAGCTIAVFVFQFLKYEDLYRGSDSPSPSEATNCPDCGARFAKDEPACPYCGRRRNGDNADHTDD